MVHYSHCKEDMFSGELAFHPISLPYLSPLILLPSEE